MSDTAIPYVTKAWNWVTGCDAVHAGCDHCWARRLSETRLLGKSGHPKEHPFAVFIHWDRLLEPSCWRRPQRVMTSAMGDFFHPLVPQLAQSMAFDTIAACTEHEFYIFTKRTREAVAYSERTILYRRSFYGAEYKPELMAPRNAMLLASVSDQATADALLPDLLRVRAVKHYGVSIEPMLGPVDLSRWLWPDFTVSRQGYSGPIGLELARAMGKMARLAAIRAGIPLLEWVIVGCESGPGRRPMELDWVRSVRDQCVAANVPFYFKQAPGRSDNRGHTGIDKYPLLDGVSWRQLPEI